MSNENNAGDAIITQFQVIKVFPEQPLNEEQTQDGSHSFHPCALVCVSLSPLDEDLYEYQFFAVVDNNYSSVAYGCPPNTFYVAFKPEEWPTIEREYPVGSKIEVKLHALGEQKNLNDDDLEDIHHNKPIDEPLESTKDIKRDPSLRSSLPITRVAGEDFDSLEYGAGGVPVVQESFDVTALRKILNEIVDECTIGLTNKVEDNRKILDNMTSTLKNNQENLREQFEEHMRKQDRMIHTDEQTEHTACQCIIS